MPNETMTLTVEFEPHVESYVRDAIADMLERATDTIGEGEGIKATLKSEES